MKGQDIETGGGETAPLKPKGSGSILKNSNMKAKAKGKAKQKVKEKTPQRVQDSGTTVLNVYYGCCGIFALCFLCLLVYLVYKIVTYYIGVFESREEKDTQKVRVSERRIDYLSPTEEEVNCTDAHPCRDWDCVYVREHFHQNLSECEYDDNMEVWSIILICLLLLIIRENCKKTD